MFRDQGVQSMVYGTTGSTFVQYYYKANLILRIVADESSIAILWFTTCPNAVKGFSKVKYEGIILRVDYCNIVPMIRDS